MELSENKRAIYKEINSSKISKHVFASNSRIIA
jgi:hypothetical protein